MLTPKQIDALRDAAGQLADPINEFLIRDIARRVSKAGQLTSTAAYQVWRAQQLGISQREIKKRLQKVLGKSSSEIERLMTQAAEVGYDFDIKRLPYAQAVSFTDNAVIQQVVSSAVKLAQGNFTNITQTLGMIDPYGKALPLRDAYRSCMDFAFKQVSTGAADYNTAIRQATKNLADKGIQTIDYESGVHASLEAATRRNIMGGLGLMNEQISQHNHDQLGADGWEISAHAASAPDHEPIQGKQYSDAEYKALNGSLVRRIGTLNCGHAAFPIILGISEPAYTSEELQKLKEDNKKGVTYQGKQYAGYEATQQQRKIERSIRTQKRRILVDESTDDKDKLLTDRIRLTRLNDEYKRFSRTTGLRTQRERAQVTGFGKNEAALNSVRADQRRYNQFSPVLGSDMPAFNNFSRIKVEDPEAYRMYALDYSRRAELLSDPVLALPNYDMAVIEQEKFTNYIFNENNPRGCAKGIAFKERLGYDISNWKELQSEIQTRAGIYPVRQKGDKGHGMLYEQRMVLYGKTGKPTNTVVAWIHENGKPRMVSTYIKEAGRYEN